MTNGGNQQFRVDVEFAESVPDEAQHALCVQRALLPIVVWEQVSLRVKSTAPLTVLERFLVECLLELGASCVEELQDIASIPAELVTWLLGSLVQKGLVYSAGTRFLPNLEPCRTGLRDNVISVDRDERRDFLWFPESEEFVALPESSGVLRCLERVEPACRFPLRSKWRDATRGEILREALTNRRVLGINAGSILRVLDEKLVKEVDCPAYGCHAILDPQRSEWLTLFGSQRNKRSKAPRRGGNQFGDSEPSETIEQLLPVPYLSVATSNWKAQLMASRDGAIQKLLSLGLTELDLRPNDAIATARVSRTAVESLGRARLLTDRQGLAITLDGTIEFLIPLTLRPADEAANQWLKLDQAVRMILSAAQAADGIDTVCRETNFTGAEVLDRLWQLQRFRTVYEIRESEDFAI